MYMIHRNMFLFFESLPFHNMYNLFFTKFYKCIRKQTQNIHLYIQNNCAKTLVIFPKIIKGLPLQVINIYVHGTYFNIYQAKQKTKNAM